MSHYTIGMRSTPAMQGLADRANRKRSAALKQVFGSLGRIFSNKLSNSNTMDQTEAGAMENVKPCTF